MISYYMECAKFRRKQTEVSHVSVNKKYTTPKIVNKLINISGMEKNA